MNIDNIRLLLDKYYAGATSDEEENLLADFFAQSVVPQDMEADKKLFCSLYHLDGAHLADDIQSKMERQIDIWNMIETKTAKRERRFSLKWVVGAAASLLLLVSVGMVSLANRANSLHEAQASLHTQEGIQPREYSPEEIEQARYITRHALAKFSKALDKGLTAIK